MLALRTEPATDNARDRSLNGARIAFTGRLSSMTRAEAHDLVRRRAGIPTASVSSRTSCLVIGMHGWPLSRDGRVRGKLRQAQQLRERHGRLRIISENEFLELIGLREPDETLLKTFPVDEVSRLLHVERSTIEHWEFLGLVRSRHGAYDFQDIVSLQTITDLVRRGVRPETIRRSLAALSSSLPGIDRPLAQLKVLADASGEVVAQIGDVLLAPDGQQLLGFEGQTGRDLYTTSRCGITVGETETAGAGRQPPESLCVAGGASGRSGSRSGAHVDDLLEEALWLEEEEQYEKAAERYRCALALAPSYGEAHFNLGNVMRAMGRVEAAEELYRLAIAINGDDALAHYNLADLLEEDGRVAEAAECLRRALAIDPGFADAHFNCASCLERLNDIDGALHHWRRYVQLDPGSEWSAIARDRIAAGGAGKPGPLAAASPGAPGSQRLLGRGLSAS